MAGLGITRRLAALEQRHGLREWRPWHVVLVDVGQAEDDAVAAYEAEHGPIGEDCAVIVQFVEPLTSSHGVQQIREML